MASLPEGKSQGLSLVQLCAKYRLVSTIHRVLTISADKIKEAASFKVNGQLYSCLLIARLPSGSWTLD